MAADAVIAGAYLPPAAPDTASDVGAVHHDMSPDVSGLIDPDCCFFVSAERSRPRNRNPSSENGYSLHSLSLIAFSLGQGVELSSGKKCRRAPTVARARGGCAIFADNAGNLQPDTPGNPAAARMADTRSPSYS
jgi:hypothetical protein